MIRNIVDLGNAAPVKGDLVTVLAALEAERELPALRAALEGEGADTLAHGVMIFTRAGSITLQQCDATITLQPGEVASVAAGLLNWKAEEADIILVALNLGGETCPFAKLDLGRDLQPGGQPNAALLTTPMPETSRAEIFEAKQLSWGLWSATPYDRSTITYSFSELMYLQAGSVTLGNAEEGYQSFGAGDVFIVHRGAKASWSNAETVRKLWLIHSPD